jgi:hypothetical protein
MVILREYFHGEQNPEGEAFVPSEFFHYYYYAAL